VANQDLTGIWTADDGGRYYVHQIDSAIWWAGFSNDHGLYDGLTFCNIFSGILKGNEVSGQWAEVPRGATMNYGTLSVVPTFAADGSPVSFVATNQTGGFSATTWRFRSLTLPANLYPSIQDVFNNTYKNTYHSNFKLEYLGQLLEIVKDSMVLYGTLATGMNLPQDPFTNTFPHTWPRTYSAFRDMNHWYDADDIFVTQEDADLTCHVNVDTSYLPDDLYDGLTSEQSLLIDERISYLHPEMIMFAGSDNTDAPSQLLPGWAQTGANSVLVNGRPLNANVVITKPATSPQIAGMNQAVGDKVRVTGTMVLDTDHNPPIPFELHPVYAIDFINATNTTDISGVWGDQNGNTFYIHTVFDTVWMLIMRPLRDRTVAAVFRGNLVGNTATGDWVAIPYGNVTSFGNDMSLVIGSNALQLSIAGHNPWATENLIKLYDVPGHPCPLITHSIQLVNQASCEYPEVEGATVVYSVTLSPFTHDPFTTYAWTTDGGVPGNSSQATFQVSDLPRAGSEVTITVQVTLSGTCSYQATRQFTVLSQARAEELQHMCQTLHRVERDVQQVINQSVAPYSGGPAHRERIIEEAHHKVQELDRALAEMKRNLKQ
jgi:hypothetical protein